MVAKNTKTKLETIDKFSKVSLDAIAAGEEKEEGIANERVAVAQEVFDVFSPSKSRRKDQRAATPFASATVPPSPVPFNLPASGAPASTNATQQQTFSGSPKL